MSLVAGARRTVSVVRGTHMARFVVSRTRACPRNREREPLRLPDRTLRTARGCSPTVSPNQLLRVMCLAHLAYAGPSELRAKANCVKSGPISSNTMVVAMVIAMICAP